MSGLKDMFNDNQLGQTSGALSLSAVNFCEQAFSRFLTVEISNPADEPDLCFDGVPTALVKKGRLANSTTKKESKPARDPAATSWLGYVLGSIGLGSYYY